MPKPHIHVDTPAPIWLVHCNGRPTQTSLHADEGEATFAAQRLAEQWPGHSVVVYRSETTYIADRPERPSRPAAPPGTQNY